MPLTSEGIKASKDYLQYNDNSSSKPFASPGLCVIGLLEKNNIFILGMFTI